MDSNDVQQLIEDATFEFSLGETDTAIAKLEQATTLAPESFDAWHALAEVNFNARRFDAALIAAERAHALRPDDIFINTSLSRIWMEKGDKPRAEHFGARAKVLGWKDQLRGEQK
jgi:cytochrome c-type biogenesis protein CcmH/NrfG